MPPGVFSQSLGPEQIQETYSIQSHDCMELPSISYSSGEQKTWFHKTDKATPHIASPLFDLDRVCVCIDMKATFAFLNSCSSVLELFWSINVLYYVMFHVLCWTPGRGAAAFATANGDLNVIPNTSSYALTNTSRATSF